MLSFATDTLLVSDNTTFWAQIHIHHTVADPFSVPDWLYCHSRALFLLRCFSNFFSFLTKEDVEVAVNTPSFERTVYARRSALVRSPKTTAKRCVHLYPLSLHGPCVFASVSSWALCDLFIAMDKKHAEDNHLLLWHEKTEHGRSRAKRPHRYHATDDGNFSVLYIDRRRRPDMWIYDTPPDWEKLWHLQCRPIESDTITSPIIYVSRKTGRSRQQGYSCDRQLVSKGILYAALESCPTSHRYAVIFRHPSLYRKNGNCDVREAMEGLIRKYSLHLHRWSRRGQCTNHRRRQILS